MLIVWPVLNEERDRDRKGSAEWVKYAEIMRVLVAFGVLHAMQSSTCETMILIQHCLQERSLSAWMQPLTIWGHWQKTLWIEALHWTLSGGLRWLLQIVTVRMLCIKRCLPAPGPAVGLGLDGRGVRPALDLQPVPSRIRVWRELSAMSLAFFVKQKSFLYHMLRFCDLKV